MATAKKKKQTQTQKDKLYADIALALSAGMAVMFVYSVASVLQGVRQSGMLGSPNSYAASLAVLLSLYALLKHSSVKQRYVVVAVLTTVVVSASLWLFGATSAGNTIDRSVGGGYKTCGCLPNPN